VFVDDVGPRPRPSEKLRLVRSNLLADAWSREPGHPREKRGPVGKSQFCHDVEVDRAAFLSQFLAPHKVSAFVNDGSGRQAADQRDVFIFVVFDKSCISMPSLLVRKPNTLNTALLLRNGIEFTAFARSSSSLRRWDLLYGEFVGHPRGAQPRCASSSFSSACTVSVAGTLSPWRRAARTTAPLIASYSRRLPRSRSCSVEVLIAPALEKPRATL
jgi:hypothetical protein